MDWEPKGRVEIVINIYKFGFCGLLLAAFLGVSGITFAGGHGGKAHKASQKEKTCINLWKAGKRKQFASRKSGCCGLAMRSPLPPKSDPVWRDKKERKSLKMLQDAKKYCAKKRGRAGPGPRSERGMPPRGERGMPPRGERGMPPRGERGMLPRGERGKISKRCKPRKKLPVIRVSQVLSESKAISYVVQGTTARVQTKWNNKRSVACVRGKKVPVRVGNSPSDSNWGAYIRGSMRCDLRKNRKGTRVAQLLCN